MNIVAPELWAGPECTIVRIGNDFADQFEKSGHSQRLDDLDLFAGLGIKAIRYPVLWERIAPDGSGRCDWRWIDGRLSRLRELGVDVIAGLVHHGGGPADASLLDDIGFAAGLAGHARRVVERYPWIERWTPVNEPLTTARFAALYGHWYPHERDEGLFWRALLNQIDAVRMSMAAIREINPAARLVQTDDLGRTFATFEMRDQAGFDNVRRWAGWDLLCGHLVPQHPLWSRIAGFGLEPRLRAIADAPCPPDVIGINHYPTSDRFLDHRLHRYPRHVHGGNGRKLYADVEAIRVLEPGPPGLGGVLREAWDRYGIPLAITEVHIGCTREEQMRWVGEAWDIAEKVRREGIGVGAVTIWSLLGSHDWNMLLTAPGAYEAGVFDVSSGSPRATALATLMRGLPHGAPRPAIATAAGWWRRPIRLVHPVVPRPAPLSAHVAAATSSIDPRPLMIVGATGTLGQAFARDCAVRNLRHVLVSRQQLDLADLASIGPALDHYQPAAVINAAGWVRVDEAEAESDACFAANCVGPIELARAAARRGIATVNFSSDLVFAGRPTSAYVESDSPAPLGEYGRSKAGMEQGIGALEGRHLVVRTSAFFSPFDVGNFAHAVASALERGQCFRAAADLVISPTYMPDLTSVALDLLIDGSTGLWHLTNRSAVSWADFARMLAAALDLPVGLVISVPAHELALVARRPAMSALDSIRGAEMPSLTHAVARFAAGWPVGGKPRTLEAVQRGLG
jgi:dTDP-4-dehydrorhamnose reductase